MLLYASAGTSPQDILPVQNSTISRRVTGVERYSTGLPFTGLHTLLFIKLVLHHFLIIFHIFALFFLPLLIPFSMIPWNKVITEYTLVRQYLS